MKSNLRRLAGDYFASLIVDAAGPEAFVSFDISTVAMRPVLTAWISDVIDKLDAGRWEHAWSRLCVAPEDEMEQYQVAVAKHEVGELFRSFRGQIPELPPGERDPELDDVGVPDWEGDAGGVDLLAEEEEPDEEPVPDEPVPAEPVPAEPEEHEEAGPAAEEPPVEEPPEHEEAGPAEEEPPVEEPSPQVPPERQVLSKVEKLIALRLIYGTGPK